MKIGDIVNIKEEYEYLPWYHNENMTIVQITGDVIMLNYSNDDIDKPRRIAKWYLELNKKELRKKKLNSI